MGRAARGAAPWPFRVGFLLHLLQRPSSRQRVRPRRHTCCSNSQYPVASQEEVPVGFQALRKVASRGARGPLCGEYSHGPVHGDPEEELDSGPHFPYPGKPASDRESGTASHWVSPRTAPAPGGAGEERAARVGWGCRRGTYGYHFAREGTSPLPGPLPPWRYPLRSSVPGQTWKTGFWLSPPPENRRQHHPLARLPTGYHHALPPPPGGRGRSAQRGRGGGAGEGLSGTHLWGGRRCLQRGSSGYHFARGGEDPLPGPLPPSCDIPTVQCTRASLENRVLALSPPGNRREGHSLVRFPT